MPEDKEVSIVDKRVSCEAAAVARAFDNNVMDSSFDGSDRQVPSHYNLQQFSDLLFVQLMQNLSKV